MRFFALWALLLACALLLPSVVSQARAADVAHPEGAAAPAPSPAAESASVPEALPPVDLQGPLEAAERDTLLRLAWRTLTGHLTDHPIRDRDLEEYALTPRLQAARGCFVTLRTGGEPRGNQGEIEATRPLYQQVIFFTRRAATRDPRFVPLTNRDLADTTVEISVLGGRSTVSGPGDIQIERQGVFLEKWGRRALFLPGQAASKGWSPERTLDELCRQAALPAGAWKQGAKIEVFTAEIVVGPQPPPVPVTPAGSEPANSPPSSSPAPDSAP